jgi:hypothetical protein
VSGVQFIRSKKGNKYFRHDKYKELAIEKYSSPQRGLVLLSDHLPRARKPQKSTRLCPKFTTTGTSNPTLSFAGLLRNSFSTDKVPPTRRATNTCVGSCSDGPRCLFTHDYNKVAMCKEFLLKGHCHRGDACNLSHDPTPNRTPACIHYLRGACTKPETCRFAHVNVEAGANVCRDYATIGYCEKGADCTERHENECPDYANTGFCSNKKCHLPHVDRAGQLRKSAGVQNIPSQPADASSKPNSDKEDDKEDVDSDDLNEEVSMLPSTRGSVLPNPTMSSFSQQQDFISLELDQ